MFISTFGELVEQTRLDLTEQRVSSPSNSSKSSIGELLKGSTLDRPLLVRRRGTFDITGYGSFLAPAAPELACQGSYLAGSLTTAYAKLSPAVEVPCRRSESRC